MTFKKTKKDGTSTHAQEQPSTQAQEQASNQIMQDTHVRNKEKIERLENQVEVLTVQVQGLTAQVEILQRELTRAINVIQENANHAENQINEIEGAVETTRELVGDIAEQVSRIPARTATQTRSARTAGTFVIGIPAGMESDPDDTIDYPLP